MGFILYGFLFLGGVAVLYFVEQWLIDSLLQIARFLHWRKFVLAFFTVALGAAIPDFFVGFSSALHGFPQLSLGDVIGGNVVDLTLAVAVASLFSRGGIPAASRTIQSSLYFTVVAAVLPLVLLLDGTLSRFDGVLLISFFFLYFAWVFSKRERFQEVYNHVIDPAKESGLFLENIGKSVIGFALILSAAEVIVRASVFFSHSFGLPIELVGLFVVGLGNAVPETYFAVVSARRDEGWLILGDLMGSVVVCATLVLGFVSLISPIHVPDVSVFASGRFYLILSSVLFFLFARSDRKITKREGIFLIFIYLAFVITEIIMR